MASDDLGVFVRACWDEEERLAYAAVHAGLGIDIGPDGEVLSSDSDVQDHLATWYPARVLAEVEAKRQITKVHFRRRSYDWDEPGVKGFECAQCCDRYPCTTLRLLALPYADHPDYRPEWSP